MLRKPAFTFVELLIALSLFTVGMLSVIQIFPVNRRYLAQSAMTTQATVLAQQEVEIVRAQTYDSLTVGSSPAYEPRHFLSVTAGDPLSQYERQTVITLADPSTATPYVSAPATDLGMKKVTVTVFWSERAISRQYSISTLVYDK